MPLEDRKLRAFEFTLEGKVEPKEAFKALREAGVSPKDHLEALQPLPGGRFDVSFKSAALAQQFEPVLDDLPGCRITSSGAVKVVTIKFIEMDLDDNFVRSILSRYGKVLKGRFLTYPDEPSVFNGTRQYQMSGVKSIPSVLRIGNRNAWVSHPGQTRTCARCGEAGHTAKRCNTTRCYKCLVVGHTASDCPNAVRCTICGEEGHNFKRCPSSFASKVKPTKRWADVVGERANPPTQPGAEEATPSAPSPLPSSGPRASEDSGDFVSVDSAPEDSETETAAETPPSAHNLPRASCLKCSRVVGPLSGRSRWFCFRCDCVIEGAEPFHLVGCAACTGKNTRPTLVCDGPRCRAAAVDEAFPFVPAGRGRRMKRKSRRSSESDSSSASHKPAKKSERSKTHTLSETSTESEMEEAGSDGDTYLSSTDSPADTAPPSPSKSGKSPKERDKPE